ncbi:hypothetical protein NA56DRAFT_57844 [Hyaloscypha hepaticicola]|uniref:Uncharacterized protein n=1 Tax=Hyaloscypha hepaticicola TaxID=2082293 RepID=A0A2J6PDE4_9HELO|nr:hypothetical protein NA56DRAFT_57844 [Hyaloscypha hepaticicola]
MTLENDSLNNGVQHLSLNGNGMSTRNGNRMQGETIVRNGASEGSNVRSVVEKPFQNGHVIPNGKENFEPKPRTDEYDVDFSDTREFSVKRWEDLTSLALSRLSTQDREAAAEYLYWHDVGSEIEARIKDPKSTQIMKRQMGRIQAFPNVLAKLTMTFDKLIFPLEVKFGALWGLVYLNLKTPTHM